MKTLSVDGNVVRRRINDYRNSVHLGVQTVFEITYLRVVVVEVAFALVFVDTRRYARPSE